MSTILGKRRLSGLMTYCAAPTFAVASRAWICFPYSMSLLITEKRNNVPAHYPKSIRFPDTRRASAAAVMRFYINSEPPGVSVAAIPSKRSGRLQQRPRDFGVFPENPRLTVRMIFSLALKLNFTFLLQRKLLEPASIDTPDLHFLH